MFTIETNRIFFNPSKEKNPSKICFWKCQSVKLKFIDTRPHFKEREKSLEICSTTVLDVLVGAPIKISYCKSQTKSHSESVSLSLCLNRHIKNDGSKTKKTNISQHVAYSLLLFQFIDMCQNVI